MIDCDLIPDGAGLWRCSRCGWKSKRPYARPPRRNCDVSAAGGLGLGDFVAWLLAVFGIRARRHCRCKQRQHRLNALGRRVRQKLSAITHRFTWLRGGAELETSASQRESTTRVDLSSR